MKNLKSAFFIIGLFLFCFNSLESQVPGYVPIAGLVSWYPFNGNANDESINDNNGIVYGANLVNDRNGVSNSAYSCDGVDDFISLAGNEEITNDFSISFWFNPQSADPGYLIDRDFCGTDNDWSIYYSENKLNIRYGMTGADYFIIPDDINEVGNWFHIVIVRNESIGKLIYYLNGSVLDQIDYPAGAYTNTGLPILIGESNCLPDINANFNGFIDDIGIWERPLSNLEVNQLYLSCDLEITESPIDLESSVGADVQFTCASNDPEVIFQWESDMGFGFVLLSDAGQYFGVNNDTLIVTSVSMANNNQKFRCVIYSMTCNDTTEAALLSVVTGTSANNIITEDYFSLYPNPVYNDQLTIRGDFGAQFDAVLIDNYGAMVRAFNGLSGNTVLNLENIQPGMYIIRFQSSGINITKSIIIAQ